jgi:small subunit ribosomal protein S21
MQENSTVTNTDSSKEIVMSDSGNPEKSEMRPRRSEERSGDGPRREFRGDRGAPADRGGAMEVVVSHNIEKAMKILKRKLIKEGLFKELKSRRYFEKPCERKKRKEKESRKKQRKEEARMRKAPGLL